MRKYCQSEMAVQVQIGIMSPAASLMVTFPPGAPKPKSMTKCPRMLYKQQKIVSSSSRVGHGLETTQKRNITDVVASQLIEAKAQKPHSLLSLISWCGSALTVKKT